MGERPEAAIWMSSAADFTVVPPRGSDVDVAFGTHARLPLGPFGDLQE
jgi:hypothetical protein